MSLYFILKVGFYKSFFLFLLNVQRLSTNGAHGEHQWCGQFIASQKAYYM